MNPKLILIIVIVIIACIIWFVEFLPFSQYDMNENDWVSFDEIINYWTHKPNQ